MPFARLLIALRLRGVKRIAKTHPWRTGVLLVLGVLALFGVFALCLDIFQEITAYQPSKSALSVAPKTASPSYVIWRELLFWIAVLCAMPSCYRSLRDLYHRPEWKAYVVLPIPPESIYLDAVLRSFVSGLLWLVISMVFVLPLWFVANDFQGMLASLLFVSFLWLGLHLAAPGIHSFAGFSAISGGGKETWRMLSGGWVNAEAAPFLYSPAIVLAGIGFGAIPLQRGIEAAIYGGSFSGALLGILGFLGGSVVLFFFGRSYYAKSLFSVLPLLRETEVLLSGGKALEQEAPYGVFFQSLLPKGARPWFYKNLLGLARGGRVRWLQVAAIVIVGLLFLWRSASVPSWFPFAAAAASLLAASVGILLATPSFAPMWIRKTLPIRGIDVLLGRILASIFLALHVGLPLGIALWVKGAPEGLWLIVVSLLGGALGGLVSDVPLAKRNALGVYSVVCLLALGLGRFSWFMIPISLGGFVFLALLFAQKSVTAPEKQL